MGGDWPKLSVDDWLTGDVDGDVVGVDICDRLSADGRRAVSSKPILATIGTGEDCCLEGGGDTLTGAGPRRN